MAGRLCASLTVTEEYLVHLDETPRDVASDNI